jgi:hypothetical protein
MSSAISGPQVSGVGELQRLDADLVPLAPARGALDDVDQLTHVARPAIAAQARLGIAGQAEDSAVTAGEPIREVARQRDGVDATRCRTVTDVPSVSHRYPDFGEFDFELSAVDNLNFSSTILRLVVIPR